MSALDICIDPYRTPSSDTRKEAAAELAQLRDELNKAKQDGYHITQKLAHAQIDLEEARKVIKSLIEVIGEDKFSMSQSIKIVHAAEYYLAAHKEVKK